MAGGLRAEIWFPQQDEWTVSVTSTLSDGDQERFFETMLFCLFAARQIANLRGDQPAQSLCQMLTLIDEDAPLESVTDRVEALRTPSPKPVGRKGFTADLRKQDRGFFKLGTHGFGILSKGIGYYAPVSTLALLAWLLDRRVDDEEYQKALGTAARGLGHAGNEGHLGIREHTEAAMKTAGAAWMQPGVF
jgi:hypothetical protein